MAGQRFTLVEGPSGVEPGFQYVSPGLPFEPDTAAAAAIRFAASKAGIEDPAAGLIVSYLETGTVSQENVGLPGSLRRDPDSSLEPFVHGILDKEWEGYVGEEDTAPAIDAVRKVEWERCDLLTRGGLSGFIDDGGHVQTQCESDAGSVFGTAGPEFAYVTEVGATAVAFQSELVWDVTEAGLVPRLLSDREHIQLGRIAADGFEPLLTILDSRHPAVYTVN